MFDKDGSGDIDLDEFAWVLVCFAKSHNSGQLLRVLSTTLLVCFCLFDPFHRSIWASSLKKKRWRRRLRNTTRYAGVVAFGPPISRRKVCDAEILVFSCWAMVRCGGDAGWLRQHSVPRVQESVGTLLQRAARAAEPQCQFPQVGPALQACPNLGGMPGGRRGSRGAPVAALQLFAYVVLRSWSVRTRLKLTRLWLAARVFGVFTARPP